MLRFQNIKMTENLEKISNYEIGFHLTSDLNETELKSGVEEIENILTKLGGNVVAVKEARRTRLSYPISHKNQSFFGTINFRAKPEMINDLKKELKLEEKILRYLILKHEENEKVLRAVTGQRSKVKTRTAMQAPKKQKEEVRPEEMEKQIEEVIEKL